MSISADSDVPCDRASRSRRAHAAASRSRSSPHACCPSWGLSVGAASFVMRQRRPWARLPGGECSGSRCTTASPRRTGTGRARSGCLARPYRGRPSTPRNRGTPRRAPTDDRPRRAAWQVSKAASVAKPDSSVGTTRTSRCNPNASRRASSGTGDAGLAARLSPDRSFLTCASRPVRREASCPACGGSSRKHGCR